MGSHRKCNASNRIDKLLWIEFQPPIHSFHLGIGCYTILYTFGLSVHAAVAVVDAEIAAFISTKWHIFSFSLLYLSVCIWMCATQKRYMYISYYDTTYIHMLVHIILLTADCMQYYSLCIRIFFVVVVSVYQCHYIGGRDGWRQRKWTNTQSVCARRANRSYGR